MNCDPYHRWEPLAEFQFNNDSDEEDSSICGDNYIYCVCSRVSMRNGLKSNYVDKDDASESDVEIIKNSTSQEWDNHSHVHFSAETSYKVKSEKDVSCYCSASHTENCCSTDEHDATHVHKTSHSLQPSDSGADLTYPDYSSELIHDKHINTDDHYIQNTPGDEENYMSEVTFNKFWTVNGERLIWASWIKKYSDYINPAYLDENNDLVMDESNIPKQHSFDQIYEELDKGSKEDLSYLRERKFSYDSTVNPYHKKHHNEYGNNEKNDKVNELNAENIETWEHIARQRSCSEHDRMLSPKTIAGTDSMTNVTKITLSSYDVTSSHVTSESSPTDDYSYSSSTSDHSNDQTRIINVDDTLDDIPIEDLDTEQYWQFLWKKHFGEQYALHYANYIEAHNVNELPTISVETEVNVQEESTQEGQEYENSDGNSQELPTVIEVRNKVQKLSLKENIEQPNKVNKPCANNKYLGSVGVLLQYLLEEENKINDEEVTETGESKKDRTEAAEFKADVENKTNVQPTLRNLSSHTHDLNEGDDEPPEEKPVTLKRSHEIEEEDGTADKIKSTFEYMGFCVDPNNMPKGELVYRKRVAKLRPPRYRRYPAPRKTYFDDDGNSYEGNKKQDEKDIPTDEESPQITSDVERTSSNLYSETSTDNLEDSFKTPLKPKHQDVSYVQDKIDYESNEDSAVVTPSESKKRKRRAKRNSRADQSHESEIPPEIKADHKMMKYWNKRHSLFHKFDEGIQLDVESWFSVTPESVARHIADKRRARTALDAFCGAGGNTIQFAHTCHRVIAIDIDPAKIAMARHNATVYGVADKIQFIVGDFFELAPQLSADLVFLSPPWGGPNYSKSYEYDIETMLEPRPASELMKTARQISNNIALYLPRNTMTDQILALAKETGGSVEIEQSFLDRSFVAITAYFY